jgi:rubrerythrin
MKITEVKNCPPGLNYFDKDDLESKLEPQDIEDIVEIFQTPLTGSYNWDYTDADNRLKKLYELGKKLNWNATLDLDWSNEHYSHSDWATTPEHQQLKGFKPYDDLSEEKKIEVSWHLLASSLSQIVHGEQGALLVASQLVSCAPTYNAKLYAASQTFDEARHVEVFNKYLQERIGFNYPVMPGLKLLLDKILSDPRWDLKFIGMQIIIEGLALAAFERQRAAAMDPLLKDLFYLVIRDEARHVTFGVNYLEEFVQTLSDEEKEERADFAYEACVVMRNRFGSDNVMKQFGWNVEEAQEVLNQSENAKLFNNLLFAKIMPNLKRIGLLTEKTLEKYEEMDILQFQDLEDHGNIDWDELSQPLDYSSKTA